MRICEHLYITHECPTCGPALERAGICKHLLDKNICIKCRPPIQSPKFCPHNHYIDHCVDCKASGADVTGVCVHLMPINQCTRGCKKTPETKPDYFKLCEHNDYEAFCEKCSNLDLTEFLTDL